MRTRTRPVVIRRVTAGGLSAALFAVLGALWVVDGGAASWPRAVGVVLLAAVGATVAVGAAVVVGRVVERGRPAPATVHVPEQRGRGTVRVGGRVHTDARVDVAVTLVDRRGRLRAHALVGRRHEGRYRLEVPHAGTWHLIVSAPGHVAEARRLSVDPDEHDVHEDVTLTPSPE